MESGLWTSVLRSAHRVHRRVRVDVRMNMSRGKLDTSLYTNGTTGMHE